MFCLFYIFNYLTPLILLFLFVGVVINRAELVAICLLFFPVLVSVNLLVIEKIKNELKNFDREKDYEVKD